SRMFSRFYRLGSDLLYRPRLVLPDRLAVARAEDEGDDPPHDGLYLGVVRGQRDEGLVRGRLWVEAVGDEGAPVEVDSHRRGVWVHADDHVAERVPGDDLVVLLVEDHVPSRVEYWVEPGRDVLFHHVRLVEVEYPAVPAPGDYRPVDPVLLAQADEPAEEVV